MNNPWALAAQSYGNDLNQGIQIQQQGVNQAAQLGNSIYDRFINGYMMQKQLAMKEQEAKLAQQNFDRQMLLANETLRHNRTVEEQNAKNEKDKMLREARGAVLKKYENFNSRIPGAKEILEADLKTVGLSDIPLPSVSGVDTNVELPGPVQPGQRLMLQTEDRLSGLGPAAYDSEQKQIELERQHRAGEEEKALERQRREWQGVEDRALRAQMAQDANANRAMIAGAVQGLRRDQYEDKKAEKKKVEYNQDYGSLVGSFDALDRLGAQAKKVLEHKGLPGTTGLRGRIPDIPGSDAANARAELKSLTSQVGFAVLQNMRNNSKTGGALGNVSDAEGKRLEAALGALESSQDVDQLKANLKGIIDYVETSKGNLTKVFKVKHGGGEDSITDAAGRREPPSREPSTVGSETGVSDKNKLRQQAEAAVARAKAANDNAGVLTAKARYKKLTGEDL